MQPAAVNLLASTPQQAAGLLTLKVLSAEVPSIPTGTVVRAAVTSVADGKAELQVNGQLLTVRAQPALTPGTELAVRVTPTGLEAVVIPPSANPNPTSPTPNAPAPAPVVVAQAATPPPALQPAAVIQVASLAPAPVAGTAGGQTSAAVPASEVPPPTDGTVSPTSTSAVPTRTSTPTAGNPASQPVVVAPNVSIRAATPPPPQVVQQVVEQTQRGRQQQPVPARPSGTPTPTNAPAAPVSTAPTVPARTSAPLPQLSVVEVLPPTRSGVPQVRVDGRSPAPAESSEPLTPGTKLIAQVVRTSQGVRIIPVPVADTPQLMAAVSSAVLKQARPVPIGEVLPKLVKELDTASQVAARTTPPAARPAGQTGPPRSGEILAAARPTIAAATADLREAVRNILPDALRPPSAAELKSLVEDGGQKYEGKLARQADGGEGPSPTDLKGALLKLFEAVPAVAHAQYPAAKAALDGIEHQQAANVLAQQTGGPLVLQVPFPDGPHWRTLHLAVEPEQTPDGGDPADGRAPPFRMLMHVPLSDLGDTWIDAGLSGDQFRAVLYLETAGVRDRVRGELPGLQTDLRQSGFTEVLLDVRPTTDLTDRQRQRGAAMSAGVPISTSVIDARA